MQEQQEDGKCEKPEMPRPEHRPDRSGNDTNKGNTGEEQLCTEQPSQEDSETTRDQGEAGG